MSNDCSERICQFGLAHVDTPKGDLDSSSGGLTGPDTNVVVNDAIYPYGTTEQYPAVKDIDGNVLMNTAHEYRECSNKGICDRATATCACFEGYEGSACQRASCPTGPEGVCSGHGTCETISEIAKRDYFNIYKLWDEDLTMGCVCDGGYEGPDCSMKKCKYGIDPYYLDNNATIRYSNYTLQLFTMASVESITGNYSIIFYDSFGEDWQTEPIPWDASCDVLTTILEKLPNAVIPANSVRCFKGSNTQSALTDPIVDSNVYIKSKYTIAFPENPGKLRQIEINKYLDGTRPTLFSSVSPSTMGWHIYPNGFIGEDVDMVPDRCFGVTATISDSGTYYYLDGLDAAEAKLLKACLGDGNGVEGDNVDVYNWDLGSVNNPHLIKLQEATQYHFPFRLDGNGDLDYDATQYKVPKTQLCDSSVGNPKRFGKDASNIGFCSNKSPPGFYAVMYYTGSQFQLLTPAGQDYDSTTPFFLYTTTGHLQVVSNDAGIFTDSIDYSTFAEATSHYSSLVHLTNTTSNNLGYFGDISCETNPAGSNEAYDCLNKDDYVIFLQQSSTKTSNPAYPNIYQVKKISREDKQSSSMYPDPGNEKARLQIRLDYSMNKQYTSAASVYKFYPPTKPAAGGYQYAGPCSMRGTCNAEVGLCECFTGYTDDDCSCLNALSM